MKKPRYSRSLLSSIACRTKNIDDHERLIALYLALHEQGDIIFSTQLQRFVSLPLHYFRFVKDIDKIDELCQFNLKLQDLQQRGFAIVTQMLVNRIAFQREEILSKK